MVSKTIRNSAGFEQSVVPGPASREDENGFAEIFHKNQRYTLSCYDAVEDLKALRKDWQALETVSNEGFDYFQSFDWCYSWCKHFVTPDADLNSDKPQVYVLSYRNRPVMIWPLVQSRSRSGLFFLEIMSDPLGQYANVLFDPEIVDLDLGGKVWSEIKGHTFADAIALHHFPENSLLAKIVGDEGFEETIQYVSSILDFSRIETWETYFASLGRGQRKERKRNLRRLSERGELTFEAHFHTSEDYEPLVEKAIELKREWLKATDRHSQGLFKDESTRFLASLGQYLPRENPQQGPVVQALKLDGEAIALEIGMLKGGHYYSYLGAIDLKWSTYSPGKVQMEMSQQWALEIGVSKFDFLSDPSDYKKYWTNTTVAMHTRYLPVSVQGHFYCSFWKAQLKPFLRAVYQRSNPNFRKKVNRLFGLAKGKPKTAADGADEVKGGLKQSLKSSSLE